MNLKAIFLPWLVIREARQSADYWHDAYWKLAAENGELKRIIAKFDHDGDGKPGGSKKRS